MARDDGDNGDELPSVDHGPLNEGPWEKWVSEISLASNKNGFMRLVSQVPKKVWVFEIILVSAKNRSVGVFSLVIQNLFIFFWGGKGIEF